MNLERIKTEVPENVFEELQQICSEGDINTELRVAHFLAQVAHESGNFSAKYENLNYSKNALLSVFKKYFTDDLAEQYQRKPEKIANRVYANRMENGDEESGDGWKYRGRGFIQLTGKQNYSSMSMDLGVDFISNPDRVAEEYPMRSAAWFWKKNNLSSIADEGSSDEVVAKVTKRVNGGHHGLEDRINKFKKFYSLLT